VALRQWVLTFAFAWRRRLAHDGALLRALTRIFSSAAVKGVIGPRKPPERRPSLSRVGAGYATRRRRVHRWPIPFGLPIRFSPLRSPLAPLSSGGEDGYEDVFVAELGIVTPRQWAIAEIDCSHEPAGDGNSPVRCDG